MATKNDLRILAHHLDTDPDNPKDALDILWEGLPALTIEVIESKLSSCLLLGS